MRLFYATCVKVVVAMLSLTVSQSAGWMFISLEEFLCLFTVLLVSVASLADLLVDWSSHCMCPHSATHDRDFFFFYIRLRPPLFSAPKRTQIFDFRPAFNVNILFLCLLCSVFSRVYGLFTRNLLSSILCFASAVAFCFYHILYILLLYNIIYMHAYLYTLYGVCLFFVFILFF